MIEVFVRFLLLLILLISCARLSDRDYSELLQEIGEHTELYELVTTNGKGRICVAPAWQGKVLTSTTSGLQGDALGWLDLTKLGTADPYGSKIGGEDRLWIGPLGSQFSFYYQQLKPLNEANWQVPPTLDTLRYTVRSKTKSHITMTAQLALTNHIGTAFVFDIRRTIEMLDSAGISSRLGLELPHQLATVAFESRNVLTNIGAKRWNKSLGLPAIWSAGMFEGNDQTWAIIPLSHDQEADKLYKYFGELDQDRVRVVKDKLFFKVDGRYRSKIGVPWDLSTGLFGCVDLIQTRITIVQHSVTTDGLYFNSHVSVQDDPYQGEAISVFNNGPMDLTIEREHSFFELESTSTMKELEPGESLEHLHTVYHFDGSEEQISAISESLLGVRWSLVKDLSHNP